MKSCEHFIDFACSKRSISGVTSTPTTRRRCKAWKDRKGLPLQKQGHEVAFTESRGPGGASHHRTI